MFDKGPNRLSISRANPPADRRPSPVSASTATKKRITSPGQSPLSLSRPTSGARTTSSTSINSSNLTSKPSSKPITSTRTTNPPVKPSPRTPAARPISPLTRTSPPVRRITSPVLKRSPTPLSGSSSSSGTDVGEESGSSESSSPRLLRAVVAPPVQAPRIPPKRTTVTGKSTNPIKVKLPSKAAVTPAKAHIAPAAGPSAHAKCSNCRGLSMDPIAMELQANDKAHRKIMDLEISNTSLLAVNSSLENTMRQQAQELEDLREELERLRQNSALSPESVTRHQRQAPPEYPPLAWSSTHEEEGDDDADEIAFARVCAKVQQMIEDGLKSTQYRVPSSILDDDEPESRRGVDDSGSLGRTPGALRKRSSSMSIDSDYKPMAIKVHHNHKPPLAPGHATTKGRSPSFTRSVSSRSSCDSVASYNSTRSSNSHGYLGDKESSSAVKARRLSIVMRPVIDAPTHTYLDDPYESLDSSTSSNNQMLSYSMQSSASSSAPY